MLRNVRVVALDQTLGSQPKPPHQQGGSQTADPRVPKTITLEADEKQAQALFVAMQLGKLQLAVRPLEGAGLALPMRMKRDPLWASDVSPPSGRCR